MKPQETKQFMEDVSGRFEGVGMEIGVKANGLQVIAPLEGTPAQRAGLRAGDKIIKIDGQSTQDMTVDEAARLIRGPKGTKVTLTIFRDEWDKVQDIEIERAVIKIPSLEWKLIDDNIAYIKIYHFTERAGFEFSKIAIQVLASGADRIILDLRNNPGGYLEVANNIASYFLKKGSLITIEDSGEQKKEHRSRMGSVFTEYPMVILINEGSASGSEILAGALRDNRGIKLIGKQSFGKGSVQRLEDLSDGSSLKVTTAKWLTPKGETIHGVGLKPDIEVDLTEQDYLNNKDPQLDKAIEVIKNL
jgi:carboxyl-terminal processing protease